MEQPKKKCPYCGEEIMATAKKCRHCGEWLNDFKSQSPESEKKPSKHSNKNKILLIGAVVVAMIVIATIIFSNGSDSKPSSDMTTPSDQEMVNGNMTTEDNVEVVEVVEDENSETVQRIKSLHGEYLANADAFLDDVEMARQYGKYFINFNDFTITYYSWDNNHDKWVQSYKTTYEVDGHNYLIYTNESGNKVTMYTGDLNEDGKMDIWLTDSIFWTKQ